MPTPSTSTASDDEDGFDITVSVAAPDNQRLPLQGGVN
jgi:hypothetical protein